MIEMPAVSAADMCLPPPLEGSAEVRDRVATARDAQRHRLDEHAVGTVRTNAHISGTVLEATATPDADGLTLLREAAEKLRLSARGFHRTLRVARTLADLSGEENVHRHHVAEALGYRGEILQNRMPAAA